VKRLREQRKLEGGKKGPANGFLGRGGNRVKGQGLFQEFAVYGCNANFKKEERLLVTRAVTQWCGLTGALVRKTRRGRREDQRPRFEMNTFFPLAGGDSSIV